jgi:RNA polymerase sigma factor (TIGR02999 family)
MMTPSPGAVTALLRQVNCGDLDALARLIELIYPDLRDLARRQLKRERPGHLWQSRELVNEVYLRLTAHQSHNWQNRAHFFGAASTLMRRLLVDFARAQHARKRGSGEVAVALEDAEAVAVENVVDVLALDDALDALERLSPRQARIVHLRYFGGLSIPEVAEVLGITSRTVVRDWTIARAWLRLRLMP